MKAWEVRVNSEWGYPKPLYFRPLYASTLHSRPLYGSKPHVAAPNATLKTNGFLNTHTANLWFHTQPIYGFSHTTTRSVLRARDTADGFIDLFSSMTYSVLRLASGECRVCTLGNFMVPILHSRPIYASTAQAAAPNAILKTRGFLYRSGQFMVPSAASLWVQSQRST